MVIILGIDISFPFEYYYNIIGQVVLRRKRRKHQRCVKTYINEIRSFDMLRCGMQFLIPVV